MVLFVNGKSLIFEFLCRIFFIVHSLFLLPRLRNSPVFSIFRHFSSFFPLSPLLFFASYIFMSCKAKPPRLFVPRLVFHRKVSHVCHILVFFRFSTAFFMFFPDIFVSFPLSFLKSPVQNCANMIQDKIILDFFMCSLYNQNVYSLPIRWVRCAVSSPEHIF